MVRSGAYVVEQMSTDDVVSAERVDYWTQVQRTTQFHMDLHFPSPATYRGSLVRQRSSAYALDVHESLTLQATRTRHHIRRDPDEDYRLAVMLAGSPLLSQEDQQVQFAAGTATLWTVTSPFRSWADSYRLCSLRIPRAQVENRLGPAAQPSTAIDLSSGLGAVVATMLRTTHLRRAELTALEFDAVCDRMVELLCMVVDGADAPEAAGHLPEVEVLVRQYVHEHAADPSLTGTAVAAALGWSLRQVQLVLQRAGTTPRDLIRDERLRLARDLLQSPAHRSRPVGDIAAAAGFSSLSALSTAFRRRYGESPRDFRHRRLAPPD